MFGQQIRKGNEKMTIWKMALENESEGVDFNLYQKLAQRTSATTTSIDKIANGLMGMNGESGEALDILKKYWFQGHELDVEKIIEEAGDVLWYIAELCSGLGITVEDLARHNIEKLYNRYPDGFEVDKSVNREQMNVMLFMRSKEGE